MTVLSRVTVIDVERGVALPDQDVVIEGRRILAVRRHASGSTRRDARIIDGRGRYVIPGLWDMHTHLTYPPWRASVLTPDSSDVLTRTYFGGLLLAAGVTGIREMSSDLATLRHWKAEASADPDGAPLPQLVETGGKLGLQPVLPGAPFPLRSAGDVRTSVRMLREAGAGHVKLEPEPPLWLLNAATSACRTEGIRCTGHVPASMDMVTAASAGMSFDHLFFIADNVSSIPFDTIALFRRQAAHPTLLERVLWKAGLKPRPSANAADTANVTHSPEKAATVFRRLADTEAWVTPTLTLHDMMLGIAPMHAAARDSSLITERGYAPPRVRSEADLVNPTRQWNLLLTLVREMQDAGVNLLAGTDIPLRAVPGAALHMELGLLQSAGLSPAEALRTATINPARYLGAQDTLGTVAAGRVADLVVLRRNPLEDVAAVEEIEMVFQRGRAYSRDDLDRLRRMARAALVTFRRAEDAARGSGATR